MKNIESSHSPQSPQVDAEHDEEYQKARKERWDYIIKKKESFQSQHIEWLRWLVLIGSATLAFVVPILDNIVDDGPRWAIRLSILCLAFGIVLLSIRIFGYINANDRSIKIYFDRYANDSNEPVVVHIPKAIMKCEHGGYILFAFGIIFLVVHSWL